MTNAFEILEERKRDLNDAVHKGRRLFDRSVNSARDFAECGSDRMEDLKDDLRQGMAQSRSHVRKHPLASLGVAFGVGVAAGAVLIYSGFKVLRTRVDERFI